MDKLKRIKVMTPKGEKFIVYRPIDEIPTDGIICDVKCPYGEICGKLPDPRNPEDKDLCFIDFCNTLGEDEGDDEKISTMVPNDGEMENLFKDEKDILQFIIESNPVYKLSDIIDSCCPNICEYYNPDHTDCNIENKMCLIRGLFFKRKKGKKDNK